MSKYKKMMRQMEREQKKLDTLVGSRQAIIDPYAGVKDLSAMISNPFANLQVATKAAEMEARETDISLASTLDALRATGGGSATALAQAASRAKQGIASSIEQQEARNAQLAAQGEQQAMQMRMAEAQRMQEADILGKTFGFQAQEQRDVADISRQAAMVQQTGQWAQDIRSDNKQMLGNIIQGALSAGGSVAGAAIAASERSLKKNIKLIGKSKSGINIYLFEYIDKVFGNGVYQGVIADEIPSFAIVPMKGYKAVDYSKIDVEFKRIK